MNANNQIEDKSTAATSGNCINSDHICSNNMINADVSVPSQDQHIEDNSGFSVPVLPPLTLIDAPSDREKRKDNSMCFEVNNTIRKDSIQVKRQQQGDTSYIVHPAKLDMFKKCLNQTNVRRILEGGER